MARLKIDVCPQHISVTTTSRSTKQVNVLRNHQSFEVIRDGLEAYGIGNEFYQSETTARKRARQLYGYSKLGDSLAPESAGDDDE